MRIMNLPPFPGGAFRIEDLGEYLKTKLALDTVPWPDHSWRLLAHMAWPNDASRRDLWMAAQIGTQLDPEKPAEGEGASTRRCRGNPALPAGAECLVGVFHAVRRTRAAGAICKRGAARRNRKNPDSLGARRRHSPSALRHDRRQPHETARRGEHTQGYRFDSGAIPQQGAQRRELVERSGRSSRTLLISSRLPSCSWRTPRCEPEGKGGASPHSCRLIDVVMLAPEAVLAVGKSLQEYGLDVEVHGREDPLFDPNTVWRIPDWINVEPLPPPPRKLTTSDIHLLNARRAHRPRPRGERPTLGGNSIESLNDRRTE